MEFTYCPKCKNKLTKTEKNLYVCSECDTHLYINPVPSNAVIIENNKGEILFAKRKREPSADKWDFPGGFIDIEESAEESVTREIKEELDIEIYDCKYIMSVPDRYLFKGLNYYTIAFIFTAKTDAIHISANDDISEVRYFKKDELPYDELAFPSMKNVIEHYLAK